MTDTVYKTNTEIDAYKAVASEFSDYTRFEVSPEDREKQKAAFITGENYTPRYSYPKLDGFVDDAKTIAKKSLIQEAVMELEAAKSAPGANVAELELYEQFHEMRLKRIMLVEAARNLSSQLTMSDSETNRESFLELNEAIVNAKDAAYTHIENAFRSTDYWMKGVIFTKLKMYYEGFRKNAQYFEAHADNLEEALDIALIGKFDHTNPEELALIQDALKLQAV